MCVAVPMMIVFEIKTWMCRCLLLCLAAALGMLQRNWRYSSADSGAFLEWVRGTGESAGPECGELIKPEATVAVCLCIVTFCRVDAQRRRRDDDGRRPWLSNAGSEYNSTVERPYIWIKNSNIHDIPAKILQPRQW
jgi:hypothetical protein